MEWRERWRVGGRRGVLKGWLMCLGLAWAAATAYVAADGVMIAMVVMLDPIGKGDADAGRMYALTILHHASTLSRH